MDKDRQLRFLIPPFFVVATLLWGAYLSGQLWPYLHDATNFKLGISILGVIGFATLPAGYFIGTVTITILKFLGIFRRSEHLNFEIQASKISMEEILKLFDKTNLNHYLYHCAFSAYMHALVRPEIREWMLRRWNACNVAAQCVTAILMSIPLAHAFHIQVFACAVWKWWASIAVIAGIFAFQSVCAWRDIYN
jgi:hypothetical protein